MATKREQRVTKIKGRYVQTIMDTLKHRMRIMLRERKGHFPEVCAETGLSRELISRLHNGLQDNPTLETAVRLAEACGYSLIFVKKDEATTHRNRRPAAAAARRQALPE